MTDKKKSPWIHITKRTDIRFSRKIGIQSLCFLGAIVISILFLWAVGQKDPFQAIVYIFEGTFQITNGSLNTIKLWSALQEMVILLAIALALTPCYRMKFWNIGAQGQLLIGGLLTATSMIYLNGLVPSYAIILISVVASLIGGALWAWIPAFFKARFETNETLFTLMMNYLAVLLVTLAVNVWKGSSSAMRTINQTTEAGYFPVVADQKVLLPLILVGVLAVSTFVYLRFTKHGYEIKVVGDSLPTAQYSGIPVRHVIRRTLALCGALAGLVGFFYVSCFDHTISPSTSGAYGFTAIIVCWLSHFNPFLMIGYASLIIFLDKGARNLSNVSYAPNLNEYSTQFVVFVIILSILISEFFLTYRVFFRTKKSDPHQLLVQDLSVKG